MARPRSWSDDDLRAAVPLARNISEATALLGLSKSGWNHLLLQARIAELGLDTTHFRPRQRAQRPAPPPGPAPPPRPLPTPQPPKRTPRGWSDADLVEAVREARSIAGVLRALGLKPGGGTYITIRSAIAQLGLDTSHFTGKGWAKGLRNPVPRPRRPLAEILVRDSDYLHTNELRKRLLKEGLKQLQCECCNGTEWNGKTIPLQLDHINGDRTDNRLVNLRLLCPNCHAQTDTYCGKNIGRTRG